MQRTESGEQQEKEKKQSEGLDCLRTLVAIENTHLDLSEAKLRGKGKKKEVRQRERNLVWTLKRKGAAGRDGGAA